MYYTFQAKKHRLLIFRIIFMRHVEGFQEVFPCMVLVSNPTHYSKVGFTEEYDYVPFIEPKIRSYF